MKTASPQIHASRKGIVFVEMMVSMAIGSVLMTVLIYSFIAQDRAFSAALSQMQAQGDEGRVLAYLARDLRQASSIQLTAGGTNVTITIPNSTTTTLNLNLGLPLLSILSPSSSAPTPTTIQYYRQGTTIIRSVGGQTTDLSSSASQFQVSVTGNLAQVVVAFPPQFTFQNGASSAGPIQTTAVVDLPNLNQ